MKGDRIWSAEEAGVEVEKLIGSDPPIHREAWRQLKGWYWAAANCAPPPSPVTLERVMAERVDLYRYIPPLGANIPIYVEPFPVYDLVPMVWGRITVSSEMCPSGTPGINQTTTWFCDASTAPP